MNMDDKFTDDNENINVNIDKNKINYLFDIIKFLIDKSLNIKNIKDNITIQKFDEFYINKYKHSFNWGK